VTIQQKLDLFAQQTLESVNRQRHDAALEIQEAIKTAIQKTEEAARRHMEDRIKTEKYKSDLAAHKSIHAATITAKQNLAVLRERLTHALLVDLEKDLRNFTDTPAFKDFLLAGIIAADAVAKDFPILQLMARDIAYKESIETELPFTVEATAEDFIGGFRLISADRRATADYTLFTRLGDLNENRSNFWN